MPISIDILNKQKRVSVELSRLQSIVERLSDGVFAELRRSPVKWLKRAVINQFEKNGTLSLVLVSNKKMREMNRKWRGKDYATDVLSFPLAVEEDGSVSLMPGQAEVELGELVISLEKAGEQAVEYGHSFEREFAFLFVHGMLHVLGFDHITKEQEKEMFGRQTKILEESGFPR